MGDGADASEDILVNAQDQRTPLLSRIAARQAEPTEPTEQSPRRTIPEWLRRRNAGQLKAKDMTGAVKL